MLLVLCYVLTALVLGGYTTYLLATALPPSLLERAARHGRFAGLGDDAPSAVSDAKPGAQSAAPSRADRDARRC